LKGTWYTIDGNTLGLKLFIPRISLAASPEPRAMPEQILVPQGPREKLADLNRIQIEGKSRHYLKAQPINKILPRQKLDFGAGGSAES